jgi:hypothetical protein
MARRTRWWASVSAAGALFVLIGGRALDAQDTGSIGQVQQGLVSGSLVSVERQRELGLVTVGGGCSGTLLNRSWVLTADHCLTTNAQIKGPAAQRE